MVAEALRAAAYTVDGVTEALGAGAVRVLGRNEPAGARRALAGAGGDVPPPLATLVRLFLLGEAVARAEVDAVLPSVATPLLETSGDDVRAAYDLAPHAEPGHDWWTVADRADDAGRPLRPDHVLGVGGASLTLAQLTVRRPVERALDIGTGCGVQALHLSTHARRVTATDAVPRALTLAATGLALSDVEVELVEGDLTRPVEDREFDLVVANPPFVVGPRARYAYRDAGAEADELSRRAVRSAAAVLAEGGVAQLLVNWLHVRGEDWRDRVTSWVSDLGVDAWLLEREVQDPLDYVATWAADAGEQRDTAAAVEWLGWLDRLRVEAVGLGWVVLRRGGSPHRVAVEPLLHPVEQPLGPAIEGWLDRTAWLRDTEDAALLAHRFRRDPAVRLDTAAIPGTSGWEPVARSLTLDAGFRWSLPTDAATAAVIAGCDGETSMAAIAAVLARSLPAAADGDLNAALLGTVRGLVDRGILLP